MEIKYYRVGIAILNSCLLTWSVVSADLTKHLNYFETLKETDIKSRTKREITQDIHEIWLTTLGRKFHLKLKESKILSSNFETTVEDNNGQTYYLPPDGQKFYSGILLGRGDSTVNVYWEDKILTASITTDEDIYVVEPSWRYLPTSRNHSMIAYRKSDIKVKDKDANPHKFCDSERLRSPRLSSIQEEQYQSFQTLNKSEHSLSRRATYGSTKTICKLYTVADFYFHQGIGGGSEISTRNYMIGIIDRVNEIYKKTKWPDDQSEMTGLGFELRGIRIFTGYSPTGHYNMRNREADMDKILTAFSENFNQNSYCMVHLFTYQGVPDGKYGLGYVASSRPADLGGICSRSAYGSSYNTATSTYSEVNGERRLSLSALITTAHGHNWGSEHDADTTECSPSESNGGKFIMYAKSQNGYSHNNAVFSPCSRKFIYKVLESRAQSCFTEPTFGLSLCGNGRVDQGEQCDPGILESDQCCNTDCEFRLNAECSDRNHECCRLCKKAKKGVPCKAIVDDNIDCKGSSVCDGVNLSCPESEDKDIDADCIDGGKCYKGQCLDYCRRRKLLPCVCSQDSGFACFRCCRAQRNGSECTNFDELLQKGRPCYQGYCDNGQCIKTNTPGNRLWNIVQSTFSSPFAEFLKNNITWVVSFMGAIFWVIGGIAVKCYDRKSNEIHKRNVEKFSSENDKTVLDEGKKSIESSNITLKISNRRKEFETKRNPSYSYGHHHKPHNEHEYYLERDNNVPRWEYYQNYGFSNESNILNSNHHQVTHSPYNRNDLRHQKDRMRRSPVMESQV